MPQIMMNEAMLRMIEMLIEECRHKGYCIECRHRNDCDELWHEVVPRPREE